MPSFYHLKNRQPWSNANIMLVQSNLNSLKSHAFSGHSLTIRCLVYAHKRRIHGIMTEKFTGLVGDNSLDKFFLNQIFGHILVGIHAAPNEAFLSVAFPTNNDWELDEFYYCCCCCCGRLLFHKPHTGPRISLSNYVTRKDTIDASPF